MASKINRAVIIAGKKIWLHANTEQEYAERIIQLACKTPVSEESKGHNFTEYANTWFEVCALPNIEKATATTYRRQFTKYLIPYFSGQDIEEMTTEQVQRLFSTTSNSKATKNKRKTVLNMIFETAVEDGLIPKNPLASKRLKSTGASSKSTSEYSVGEMRYLVTHLHMIQNPTDRAYLALQALHPMRLEEVLGLKWEDVDIQNMTLPIRRAVTHPDRNQPEVKDTKTEASTRAIGLSMIAVRHLTPGPANQFVIGGAAPLTYTQVRRMCERIKKDTGFEGKITPIRFRTTVLTDLYDQTHDIKQAQAAAGHTTSAMTLKYYVKGRCESTSTASVIDRTYGDAAAG